MSTSLHNPDRVEVVFDQQNLVSDSGLLLMATLAGRLGLPGLVGRWVHTGVPNAAVKVMTVVMGMIAGATNIDSLDRLRRVRPGRCWGSCRWPPQRSARSCGRSSSVMSASSTR